MGKEEEIARIARRLDKMVTRKSAVRGAGRQDPGVPAPPRSGRAQPRAGRDPTLAETPALCPPSTLSWDRRCGLDAAWVETRPPSRCPCRPSGGQRRSGPGRFLFRLSPPYRFRFL
jgi:hypothetical protein